MNDTAQAALGAVGLVGGLSGILGALLVARGNRTASDYQVTYVGGATVRRVERGRKVNWLLNGVPVSERVAKDFMRAKESDQSAERP